MRRNSLLILLSLAAMCLVAAGAAFGRGRHSTNINISHDDDRITSCGDLNVRFDDERAQMITQEIPAGQLRSLKVRNAYNGGIRIVGGETSGYGITACKAAKLPGDVDRIRVSLRDDELVVEGPERGDWTIFFLIRAPRNAVLDLATTNGEIFLRDVSGTVTARAKNGPVSVRNASGTIDARSVNGPVSLFGGAGMIKLQTTNGPLSVKLDSDWQGAIEGSTQNGPLTVSVPRSYRSGVIVESLGHGPITCRAAACADARRSWSEEDDRRITLGSVDANVRLSTVNGPVSVRESE
jgi:hypothetical protein